MDDNIKLYLREINMCRAGIIWFVRNDKILNFYARIKSLDTRPLWIAVYKPSERKYLILVIFDLFVTIWYKHISIRTPEFMEILEESFGLILINSVKCNNLNVLLTFRNIEFVTIQKFNYLLEIENLSRKLWKK